MIETYKTYQNRSTSMVFEAVLVRKLCSDVTVMKIFQYRIKNISMARENVSFTRYYYKVLIGGGGVGGGRIDVYTKKHGRTTRAAWDRMLYQDPCICWLKL